MLISSFFKFTMAGGGPVLSGPVVASGTDARVSLQGGSVGASARVARSAAPAARGARGASFAAQRVAPFLFEGACWAFVALIVRTRAEVAFAAHASITIKFHAVIRADTLVLALRPSCSGDSAGRAVGATQSVPIEVLEGVLGAFLAGSGRP